jgi:hypothetical protein
MSTLILGIGNVLLTDEGVGLMNCRGATPSPMMLSCWTAAHRV